MSLLKIDLTNDQPANITCKRGDTFVFETLRFWSDSAKTIPIDISAYTFSMKVINSEDEEVLSFSGASEFVVSGADDNMLTITKTAAGMLVDASPAGEPYTYDLQMTDGSGKVTTIMKGNFTIEQDIS